jgi:uncharacterized membrane protein YtjA (UPF0391 family)
MRFTSRLGEQIIRPCEFQIGAGTAAAAVRCSVDDTDGRGKVLDWAMVFLLVALVAAVFGFAGVASSTTAVAQTLSIVFLALSLLALLVRVVSTRTRYPQERKDQHHRNPRHPA